MWIYTGTRYIHTYVGDKSGVGEGTFTLYYVFFSTIFIFISRLLTFFNIDSSEEKNSDDSNTAQHKSVGARDGRNHILITNHILRIQGSKTFLPVELLRTPLTPH